MDVRDYNELSRAISLAQHTVYKRYLSELDGYYIVQPTDILMDETAERCIRFFQLEELSCKQGEDILQKLSTVYYASMSLNCNLIVMIDVEKIDAPAKIYIGVRNSGEDEDANARLSTSFKTLKSGIRSNFPGTKLHDVPSQNEMPKLVDDIFGDQIKHISSVSCVASVRDKSKTENKLFIQGLEKLIDAMRGNTYTALFIAEPITESEQFEIRSGFENLYSILSSFSKSTWSYNENESEAVSESLSKGISKSITEGTSYSQAHTVNAGVNIGINSSQTNSNTISHTKSNTETEVAGAVRAVRALSGAVGVIRVVGKMAGKINPILGGVATVAAGVLSATERVMEGNTTSHTISDTIANTVGKTLGMSGGLSAGIAQTTTDTALKNETKAETDTKTTGKTNTKGTGRTLQIENINKPIEQMLRHIEDQLNRTQECEDYGAYSCGAYFLSGKKESSLLAANTYRALMIGEGSAVESGAINSWDEQDDFDKFDALKQYLRRFIHPIFARPVSETEDCLYTPGTLVSGLELPIHLGVPTMSVYGLPVMEHAEFGRNVTDKNLSPQNDMRIINMGKIYHMGQIEKKSTVAMNVPGLTAHTFVTGSTGAGKSNTIYQMLDKLCEQGVHFLVVEPAKGEYKGKIGTRNDVTVYGTNSKIFGIELLRINPFSFPESIHVLEHMDRLVEIFNVCWPMYAAMPAILKDSIQRAYEAAGWNIETSENRYDNRIFPAFSDVYRQIRRVLEESDYSQDNKGDYTGSLVTRLRSLTNGINGLIFTSDEIPMQDMFDKNVIIDLSRIGSTETKALIMGILVLKLQEHRMNASVPDQELHHVTVLEEAHNLLRKTSMEQSAEGSNLLGKSVEMISNAIAEMRTYGEGFIIADQSPGLLDMSVIRNTNTKVILRLPDYSDRELVGRAAGLNDEQIAELSKLNNGVAVIKQSEWLEAVLCKIDKFTPETKEALEKGDLNNTGSKVDEQKVNQIILQCIMGEELYRKGERVDIEQSREVIIKSRLETPVKCDFIQYLTAVDNEGMNAAKNKLAYDYFKARNAIEKARGCSDLKTWSQCVVNNLVPSVGDYSKEQIDLLMIRILLEQEIRDASYNHILRSLAEEIFEKGGVF